MVLICCPEKPVRLPPKVQVIPPQRKQAEPARKQVRPCPWCGSGTLPLWHFLEDFQPVTERKKKGR